MADVKQGFINTILIKDLSRLGRNYLEVGNLAEVFLPEHGCELISLNERLDDMMVFRNWFNEQHSKTTSKKVKAARKICAENGKHLSPYAPYGFKKEPENRHKLIIDENTAPIVRRIFEMRASGKSARAVMMKLNEDGITPPQEYYYQKKNKKNPRRTNGLWSESVVKSILRNETYIGHMIQGKVGTVSYKSSKIICKPKDEWIKAENTHEPIISGELWDRVQALLAKNVKTRQHKDGGTPHLFSSLLYCADCGYKLRGQGERKDRPDGTEYRRNYYTCGNYARSGKQACTIHSIGETTLTALVSEHIRRHARLVEQNEERIIEVILTAQNNETTSYRAAYMSEVEAHKKHLDKLDLLIENLYNDKVAGDISADMFKRLVSKYEQERIDRLQSVETLTKRIQSIKENSDNAETWAKLIKRYTRLETLDSDTILLLIDRVVVGETYVDEGVKARDINIVYNYVGDIDKLGLTGLTDTESNEDSDYPESDIADVSDVASYANSIPPKKAVPA